VATLSCAGSLENVAQTAKSTLPLELLSKSAHPSPVLFPLHPVSSKFHATEATLPLHVESLAVSQKRFRSFCPGSSSAPC
jgi:hypothetical protein